MLAASKFSKHLKEHDSGHGHHEPIDFDAHRDEVKVVQDMLEKAGTTSTTNFVKSHVSIDGGMLK